MGDRLATIDMGRKLGAVPLLGRAAGFRSNTMWPGRGLPSGMLIHPAVWPQYTNVSLQTDRQRSDRIGRSLLQTVAQKIETVT